MDRDEWKDVQGLVLSAYPDWKDAAYLLLEITDPVEAKRWLQSLIDEHKIVTANDVWDRDEDKHGTGPRPDQAHHVNVAFSLSGLRKLGISGTDGKRFPFEFQEGMHCSRRRASMLGDVGKNAADCWEWGNEKAFPDILLMVFAANIGKAIDAAVAAEKERFRGVKLVAANLSNGGPTSAPEIRACLPDDKKEHFGFVDGISQPVIEGTEAASGRLKRTPDEVSIVKPGEFILGYENERHVLPISPTVSNEFDRKDLLPSLGERKDFGRNGSYLVVRQLEQYTWRFEAFLDAAAKNGLDREWLASRLVGRWRSGAPTVRYPNADPWGDGANDKDAQSESNQFLFHFEDRYGLKCPIGSHIRRANPRDSLDPDPMTALRLSKRHRIIRRGRLYGPKYDDDYKKTSEAPVDDKNGRGLLFICLNADIAGQFELIQHSWLNNRHFSGLYDERDPLLGERSIGGSALSIQGCPTNLRFGEMSDFIGVRGGAYLFMPGMNALRWLAT